ncbi:MAG TPA: energy transducer TonB, partial [Gammaproteobacteria bacterium]|nr:energy transducer TonB [Gammaproteobacteria bacterium]
LDRAAIKAVSQWRFTPAHRAGAPTMVVTQSIQFQLGDGRS